MDNNSDADLDGGVEHAREGQNTQAEGSQLGQCRHAAAGKGVLLDLTTNVSLTNRFVCNMAKVESHTRDNKELDDNNVVSSTVLLHRGLQMRHISCVVCTFLVHRLAVPVPTALLLQALQAISTSTQCPSSRTACLISLCTCCIVQYLPAADHRCIICIDLNLYRPLNTKPKSELHKCKTLNHMCVQIILFNVQH